VVGVDAGVAAQQLTALLARPAELGVLVVIVLLLNDGRAVLLAVRAAPLALGRLLQLRVEAAEVVSLVSGAEFREPALWSLP
jgi:hypothetical protein